MSNTQCSTQTQPITNAVSAELLPVYSGRGGHGAPSHARFQPIINVDEATKHCDSRSHVWVRSHHGDARTVKVNGKVRRWKRDANRIEIPCKYGLYEYFTLNAGDLAAGMLLLPVGE